MSLEGIGWDDVRRLESSDRNVFKYVFTTEDAVAEAVLYRYHEFANRTVICCSTMSGCPVGCRFCGSGDYYRRNLKATEISDQVAHIMWSNAIDGARVQKLQFMFMSMGEPMLNWWSVAAAITDLHSLWGNAQLLISTMGPHVNAWHHLEALSRDIPQIGLQFSVHESTDEARNRLIPFEDKMTLSEIASTGEAWAAATYRTPYFNYCAHAGNTSDEDIERLLKLFDPDVWRMTVSVICERDETVAKAIHRNGSMLVTFMGKLRARGYDVRLFDPAGQDDIGGGCGQLWHTQRWMKEHPELAKPSRGSVVAAAGHNLVK